MVPTTHLHLGHVRMRSALTAYRTSRQVHTIMDSVLGCADCRRSNRASNSLKTLKCTMPVPAAARLLRSWVRIPPGAWMFVVNVLCCQVEVCATSWSLVQRSPTDCGTSLCMWSRNVNEEALAQWGAVAPKTNKQRNYMTLTASQFNILIAYA